MKISRVLRPDQAFEVYFRAEQVEPRLSISFVQLSRSFSHLISYSAMLEPALEFISLFQI